MCRIPSRVPNLELQDSSEVACHKFSSSASGPWCKQLAGKDSVASEKSKHCRGEAATLTDQ
jgi:hypothetical protein